MRRFAVGTSAVLGSPWSVLAALLSVGGLAVMIRLRGWSPELLWTFSAWLTVVTFVMVFILQNAQNRHDRALHLKLDELLRAVEGARNRMMQVEGMPEKELDAIEAEFDAMREKPADRAPRMPASAGAATRRRAIHE